jgi:O-antigen ligase
VILALSAAVDLGSTKGKGWRVPAHFGALLAAIAVWGGVSALWSLDPGESVKTAVVIAGLFLGGLLLCQSALDFTTEEHAIFNRALLWGMSIGIVLLAIEVFRDAPTTRLLRWGPGNLPGEIQPYREYFAILKPGVSVFVLLVWPLAAHMLDLGRRLLVAAVLAAMLLIAYFSGGDTAFVALIVGTILFLLAFLNYRALGMGLGVVVIAASLLAPIGAGSFSRLVKEAEVSGSLPSTFYYRGAIWGFVSEKISDKPLLGWGLDSSRIIPGGQKKIRIPYEDIERDPVKNRSGKHELLPLHPHNAVLQIWLELGVVGVLLAVAVLVSMIRSAVRESARGTWGATYFGALGGGFVIANMSYGIWQNWWLAAIFIVISFLIAARGSGAKE